MGARGDAGDGKTVAGVTGSGWVEGPRGTMPPSQDSSSASLGRTAVPGGGCAGCALRRDQRAAPGSFSTLLVTLAHEQGKSLPQSS